MSPIIAYIDPGSGSVIFQVLIAGLLSGVYLLRGYIKKFYGKAVSLFKK
jgi:hypothetical protein